MTRFDTTLKARPTTYKGVEMRSRLEARFAAGCDKLDVWWQYEPRAFASEKGQYLPDFQLVSESYDDLFVEVKPVFESGLMVDAAAALSIIWESLPDAHCAIACPELGSFVLLGAYGEWALGGWQQSCGRVAPAYFPRPTTDVELAIDIAIGVAEGDYDVPFDWSWERS